MIWVALLVGWHFDLGGSLILAGSISVARLFGWHFDLGGTLILDGSLLGGAWLGVALCSVTHDSHCMVAGAIMMYSWGPPFLTCLGSG